MSAATRCRVLGGASLALVAAGAGLAPATAGASTVPVDAADAALLSLCAAFHHCEAERQASDGDAFDAARGREWEAFDDVAAAPPAVTEAGRAAKARVAFAMTSRALLPATPLDGSGQLDDDEVFARRVLAEVAGVRL